MLGTDNNSLRVKKGQEHIKVFDKIGVSLTYRYDAGFVRSDFFVVVVLKGNKLLLIHDIFGQW